MNWNMTIYLCKKFYREEVGDGIQLMKDIAKYTEAVRPDRNDERNIKAKSFIGFTYRVSAKKRGVVILCPPCISFYENIYFLKNSRKTSKNTHFSKKIFTP